jgi:hypothetical protein
MPERIPGEILNPALEVDAPHGHGNMEERAPLGEEGLEVSVPHEGHHEEENPIANRSKPEILIFEEAEVFVVFGERQGERGKEEERAVRERRNGKESAGERNVGERNGKENEKIKK